MTKKASKKLPAIQFYPGDWWKDPGVQALNHHEKGVWWEMLLIMFECEERGVLLLNGKPMPEAALARRLGLDPQSLHETLNTLLDYGVASMRDDGAIYCRRIVRDELARDEARETGEAGGNPKLTGFSNQPGFVYLIRGEQGLCKIGIAKNPDRRIKKVGYTLKGKVETLLVTPVGDMGRVRGEVHEGYKSKHVEGDWYDLSESDIAALRETLKGTPPEPPKGDPRPSSSSSSSYIDPKSIARARPPWVLTPTERDALNSQLQLGGLTNKPDDALIDSFLPDLGNHYGDRFAGNEQERVKLAYQWIRRNTQWGGSSPSKGKRQGKSRSEEIFEVVAQIHEEEGIPL